jgi:hypothetical protein
MPRWAFSRRGQGQMSVLIEFLDTFHSKSQMPPIMKSVSVRVLYHRTVNLYQSCVRLGWLALETTGFILVRASKD